MKIKSFGCSFIFGSELADNPDSKVLADPVDQFSQLTWPALFAKQLGYDYDCHARPGAGNLQIAERVLNECSSADSDFFIINWTFIDRFDRFNFSGPDDEWQPWSTIRPGSTEKWAEIYWKNLHSEYRDKLTTLMYIKTVIDTLLENNIKFIMTYMDDLIFDQRWHVTPAVTNLQKYALPYMTTFEGKNFLDWSRSKGYPETEAWHPLEEAHAGAADYMLKVFRKQNTVDR
jgi:hypothetical protein